MNTAVAALSGPVVANAPLWSTVALSTDGLGSHAAAWDRLNASRYGAHPALDSRFWNLLLTQASGLQVVLCMLGADAEPTAMCLLVHRGGGHWQTFSHAAAPLGPVMIDHVSMVNDLMRALRPQAYRIDLRGLDPAVCALSPQPWQHVSVDPGRLIVTYAEGCDPGGPPPSPNSTLGAHARYAVSRSPADVAAALERQQALGDAGDQAQRCAELVQAFAASGQAAVMEAFQDNRLAASLLCLQSTGWCVVIHARQAPQAAAGEAGTLWQEPMLRWAAAQMSPTVLTHYGRLPDAHPPLVMSSRRMRDLVFLATDKTAGAIARWNHFKQIVTQGLQRRVAASLQLEQLALAGPWPEEARLLMAAAGADTPQALAEWFQNLWQSVYAQHPGVHLCLVREAGQVVAALPVVVERSRAGNTLTFLSNYYTALFVPAMAPGLRTEALAFAVRELMRLHSPLAVVRLEPMDPAADHFHLLQQALELAGLSTHRYYRFGNWYLPTPGSYADFLKGRTAGLRSTIKRMGKRCQELGGQIEVLTEEADLQRGLDAYWKVYRTSWKQDEPFPEFINGLARWCAREGKLRLGILSLQNEPVAAQIWLVHGGRAEIFKVAYDEAHKAVSPGSVLTAALLEQVIDRDKVGEVDFLVGDDAYKRTWMSHRRERWGLVAFNPLRIKGAVGLVRLWGGRLVRKLRGQRLVSPAQEEAGG